MCIKVGWWNNSKQFSVYTDGSLVPSQYVAGRFHDEYRQHLQIFAWKLPPILLTFALPPFGHSDLLCLHQNLSLFNLQRQTWKAFADGQRFQNFFWHFLCMTLTDYVVYSVSQSLWDCGPVNSFFYKTRARSQQIYS